jgi:hypothetical protein
MGNQAIRQPCAFQEHDRHGYGRRRHGVGMPVAKAHGDRGSAPKPAEFVLSVSAGIPRVEDSQGFHARILGSSRFS